MQVYELVKHQKIQSMQADQSALEAARFMTEHNIGAVPVMRGGELAGIFSERDLMRRVVAQGRSPGLTKLSEVMTSNPRVVNAEESVENCAFLMREHGFRHLPIVQGKQLRGLISMRDILLWDARHSAKAG